MKSLPTAPAPGSPVSASLIGEIIAAIRARTLLRGRGYRLHETPNGTTLDIERVRGVAGVAAPRTPCRFDVTLEITNEEGCDVEKLRSCETSQPLNLSTSQPLNPSTTQPLNLSTSQLTQLPICTATFVNLYYDIGGKTYQLGDEDEQPLDSVSKDLTDDDGVPLETAVLALKAKATGDTPTATVEVYASLQELREAQGDDKFYLFPLYMVARSGEGSAATYSVTCDFRTGPILAMGEF